MEEMEITSWLTLDAIKKSKAAEIVESVGNLQTDHTMSVFCVVEDDHLELCYSDSAANTLRRYEDRKEFDEALEERKEEAGEAHFEEDEDRDYDEDEKDEDEEEEGPGAELEDETEAY
jgi:DNA-directed RNA polymerase delta subunit